VGIACVIQESAAWTGIFRCLMINWAGVTLKDLKILIGMLFAFVFNVVLRLLSGSQEKEVP
ncbi:MAG: hypothetical protein ACF8OB_03515, partial [Phycisphaeraceae bacterium JB051]